MLIRVVTGPPCSGKTTHVREHAGPLDVVIDLDAIAHALGYPTSQVDFGEDPPHPARVAAMRARASLVKAALDSGFGASCVWIIRAFADQAELSRFARAGAEFVHLDPGREVCHERADRERHESTHEQIDRWYDEQIGTTSIDW